MQDRPRPEEQERERNELSRARDREQTGRVRIPKIQYRFIQQLKESGVTADARNGAFDMAEKIRRYPVDAQAVMASWERFTKTAIADYKAQRGDPQERDAQHAAYAVLFTSLRDGVAPNNVGELRERIAGADVALRAQILRDESGRSRGSKERELPQVEQHIDKTLERLKMLSPQLRSTIEATARDMLLAGSFDPMKARSAVPDAVRALQESPNETNTLHTMSLAVIARTSDQRALLREVSKMPEDERASLRDEARARVDRYGSAESRLADVRTDAVAAAIKDAVEPSPRAHREAMVLAEVRERIETVDDPRRTNLLSVGEELAREFA